ncbi:DUF6124 family protein [Pseudomonas sp. X10]
MKLTKKSETELDSEAARRALDYYLNPTPVSPNPDQMLWTLRDDVTAEQAGTHALDLLRCAAATAHETGTHLQGSTRELMFALMHMINMARALLDQRQATQDAFHGQGQLD